MQKKYGAFSSSVDPQKLSLAVESFGKFAVGLGVLFATMKGLDPQSASTAVQAILDQGAILVSSGYTIYQASETLYGLVRKAIVFFTAKASA